jgi:putative colanic acid biosynthesis acetyltransferase WcaF
MSKLDVQANRSSRKYPLGEMLLRILWGFGKVLFRASPRPCFGWRRMILRCFGAHIGREVHVYNSTVVYFPWNLRAEDWSSIGEWVLIYNLGKVTIGPSASISHRAHLCAGTHDYTRADLPLLKPPIFIGAEAWICADSFIGPNVRVGQGAVVGAGAVVTKDVPEWTVVAGNPAREIKKRRMQE